MPNIHMASGIASVIVPIDFKIQPLCNSSAQLTGFGNLFFFIKKQDSADSFWILKISAVRFMNRVFMKCTSAKHFMHSNGGN